LTMDPKPSIEHLAISRAGSAVLGFKYHRDIAFTTTDLAIVCYSVIAMIDRISHFSHLTTQTPLAPSRICL